MGTRWGVRTNESDAEKYLFRYETQVIKKSVKNEYIQEFEEIDGILMYQGRIAQENQVKTQDLDGCKFLDFAEVPPLHTVSRSARDVSILYSAGDLLVNTKEHFSAMNEEKKE